MNDYQELTTRFLNRECSPEEARRLLAYFRSKPGDADMVKLIEATLEQAERESFVRSKRVKAQLEAQRTEVPDA